MLELLIVISLLALIFTVGTQAMLVSLRSDKNSSERDSAYNLASETLEIVRNISEENWQNIYSPTGIVKGTTHYYPLKDFSSGWVLFEGDDIVVINGISYTRNIVIDNVSRDSSLDRKIEASYNASNDDPNTQKVIITVSWSGGNPVIINGYLFRWKNKLCTQTSWATQTTPTDNAVDCIISLPDTYFSIDSGVDTSNNSLQLTGTTPKAISGTLISSIFDTTITSGAGYNSIMWKGLLGGVSNNEGKVRFQFAGSNSASGPWNYYGGSTCGSSDYFDPGNSNTPIELIGASCLSEWNNMRYFRYKVQICSNDCLVAGDNTPVINDIIVNWIP